MVRSDPRRTVVGMVGSAYVVVYHERRAVATIGDDCAWYQPDIEALADDHPRRRFVATLCLVAREMQRGEDAEPYDERTAAYYVRAIMMPDEEFDRLAVSLDDRTLAEHFVVPQGEVRAKRLDRAFVGLADR